MGAIEVTIAIFDIIKRLLTFVDAVATRFHLPAVSTVLLNTARSAHNYTPVVPTSNVQEERQTAAPAEESQVSKASVPCTAVKAAQEEAHIPSPFALQRTNSVSDGTDGGHEAALDAIDLTDVNDHASTCSKVMPPVPTISHDSNTTINGAPIDFQTTSVTDEYVGAPKLGVGPANNRRAHSSEDANTSRSTGLDQAITATCSTNLSSSECSDTPSMTDTKTRPAIDQANTSPSHCLRRSPSSCSATSSAASAAGTVLTDTCISDSSEPDESATQKEKIKTSVGDEHEKNTLQLRVRAPPSFGSRLTAKVSPNTFIWSSRGAAHLAHVLNEDPALPSHIHVEKLRNNQQNEHVASESRVGFAARENGQARASRPNLDQVASMVKKEDKIADAQTNATNSAEKKVEATGRFRGVAHPAHVLNEHLALSSHILLPTAQVVNEDVASESRVGSAAQENGQVRAYRPNLYQVASLVKEEGKTADAQTDATSSAKKKAEATGDGFDDLVRQHKMFHKKRAEKAQKAAERRNQKKKAKGKSINNSSHSDQSRQASEPKLVGPAEAELEKVDVTEVAKSIGAVHSGIIITKQRKKDKKSCNRQPRACLESESALVEEATKAQQLDETMGSGDVGHEMRRDDFLASQKHEVKGDEAGASKAEEQQQSVLDVGHDFRNDTTAVKEAHLDKALVATATVKTSDNIDRVTALSGEVDPVLSTAKLTTDTETHGGLDLSDVPNKHSPFSIPLNSLEGEASVDVPADSAVSLQEDVTASFQAPTLHWPSVEPGQQLDGNNQVIASAVTTKPDHKAAAEPGAHQEAKLEALALHAPEILQQQAAEPLSEPESSGFSTGSSDTSNTSAPFDVEAHCRSLLVESLRRQQHQAPQNVSFLPAYKYSAWNYEEPRLYRPVQHRDSGYPFSSQLTKASPPQYQYWEYPQAQAQYHGHRYPQQQYIRPQYHELRYRNMGVAHHDAWLAMYHGAPAFSPGPWAPYSTSPSQPHLGPGTKSSHEPTIEAAQPPVSQPIPDFSDFWATRCWGANGYVNRVNLKPSYLQPLAYEIEKERARFLHPESWLEEQERVFRKYGL